MQTQLSGVLSAIQTGEQRFSQSAGGSNAGTKIVNENNSGIKLVEQQQSKILEQEQVIKSLR